MISRDKQADGLAAALRFRDFRLLWLGQSVSFIGDQVFPVAVVLRVLEAGGRAGDLSLVLAARGLALALLLIPGGVLADRITQVRVMVGADVGRLLAVICLAVAPLSLPVALLASVTFLVGAGEALFLPAYRSVFPTILPDDKLQAANALTSVPMRVGAIAGPALAGLLTKLAGVESAFAFDAVTFAASVATLLAIRQARAAAPRPRAAVAREVLDGFRVLRALPWIGVLTIMSGVHMSLAAPPWFVLLPIVARGRLGGTAAYVLLLALFAAGAVAGALTAGRLQPRRPGLLSLILLTFFGGVLLGLAIPAPLPLIAVLVVIAGAGIEIFGVYMDTAMQRTIRRDMLARVMAVDMVGSIGLNPVGFLLTGWAASAFGAPAVLATAAAIMVVSSLLPLTAPGVVRLRTPDAVKPADPLPAKQAYER